MLLSLAIPSCDDPAVLERLCSGVIQLRQILPYSCEVVCGFTKGTTPPTTPIPIRWVEVDRPGHGYHVRTVMLAAQGRYRALLDPRWLVEPEQLQLLLPPVQTGAEICLGSRLVSGAQCTQEHRIAKLWRRGWSRVSSRVVRVGVSDALAPVQIYRSDAARALFSRALEDGHAITVEVLALADKMGLRIQEQAVDYADSTDQMPWLIQEAADLLFSLGRIRLRLESGAYPMLKVPVMSAPPWRPRA